jgi:hypothetical protein
MTRTGDWACAFALVSALTAIGCSMVSHPTAAPNCDDLVGVGSVNTRGDLTKWAFVFINGSGSTCSLRAPAVSLIDTAGAALEIPQDFAPGAKDAALQLPAHQAVAIPYTISSLECSQTLRFDHVVAGFSGGVSTRIPLAGELCPGSRIVVFAPIAAVSCEDGTFVWVPSGSGLRPRC